ncbi:MAG: glycosyltransferase [Bacteroidales bacterium]|nr:glycosyltransferase [Bacteroidales bacterium]
MKLLFKMDLSIVIVNYNVKHFLQQCLTSVFNALKTVDAEVWVVDNNSVDGSVQMVRENFPETKLIANKDNVGFSKANNQAIRLSTGKYILLLNPDTIVEESTFAKIVDFMDENPNAGGLGVNMIDGKGNFLPESKRGIPTPMVAFYKMFGLTSIFSKSKRFAKYYMGHLDKNETNKVEILSGAFMLLRKTVLDKIGLLDEDFFMYGEDIDLSYRILKSGFDNYYFADTKIVHYKGESTKKGSLNYVYVFYNAMIIFAKKHFAKSNARLFMFLIKMAIVFRASLSVMKRAWNNLYLPLLDATAIYAGFYFFVPFWEKIKFHETNYYPDFIWILLGLYVLIWLISGYYSGMYENPVKLKSVFVGILIGTFIILVIYALIDVKFRFSRAVILIGTGYAISMLLLFRVILHGLRKHSKYSIYSRRENRVAIVGETDENLRVKSILEQISLRINVVGFISPNDNKNDYLGNLDQIDEIVKIHKIDEVIFCAKNLSAEKIISRMLKLSSLDVSVKIAPEDSVSIIGSNSINTAGDLYTLDLNTITKANNKRFKALFDKIFAVILLVFFPIVLFFVKNKLGLFRNIFFVLIGKYSWVGFSSNDQIFMNNLPLIKKGILSPIDSVKNSNKMLAGVKHNFNVSYAKNYRVTTDIFIIFKGFNQLGK